MVETGWERGGWQPCGTLRTHRVQRWSFKVSQALDYSSEKHSTAVLTLLSSDEIDGSGRKADRWTSGKARRTGETIQVRHLWGQHGRGSLTSTHPTVTLSTKKVLMCWSEVRNYNFTIYITTAWHACRFTWHTHQHTFMAMLPWNDCVHTLQNFAKHFMMKLTKPGSHQQPWKVTTLFSSG